jgi:hypothetical protein
VLLHVAVHFVPLVAGRMQGQVELAASTASASGLALHRAPAQQAAAMFSHAALVLRKSVVQYNTQPVSMGLKYGLITWHRTAGNARGAK